MTNLQKLHSAIADHACDIETLFRPGAKVTIIVRNPEHDVNAPHSASVFVSTDDPAMVIEALQYLRTRDAQTLAAIYE